MGYDHGAYRHFIDILIQKWSIQKLPMYIQTQFEPFSGSFFYFMTHWVSEKYLFNYWYLLIYLMTSISIFILWKRNSKYTSGSYLGLFLFIFSILQYNNLWWSFGKQIFATFFLVVLMKYYKSLVISLILLTACLSLHRLTGFIALSFFLLNLFSFKKKQIFLISLVSIILSFVTYIPTFSIQILPFIMWKINNYIFITQGAGTWFNKPLFWMYELPLLVVLTGHFVSNFKKINITQFKNPYFIVLLFILVSILLRWIAHNRLESFLDLFLILFLTKYYIKINKKIIAVFLILYTIPWFLFTQKWHKSFIDRKEDSIIRNIVHNMPENVSLVTLTWAYMSMMTAYTEKEVYSTYQGIWSIVFDEKNITKMRHNQAILCGQLALLPGKVFVYVGSKEKFKSTINNNCLRHIRTWENNAKFYSYENKFQ